MVMAGLSPGFLVEWWKSTSSATIFTLLGGTNLFHTSLAIICHLNRLSDLTHVHVSIYMHVYIIHNKPDKKEKQCSSHYYERG